jgi:hypothetical protein
MFNKRTLALSMVLFSFFAALLGVQEFRATITGTVTDPMAAVIPGAADRFLAIQDFHAAREPNTAIPCGGIQSDQYPLVWRAEHYTGRILLWRGYQGSSQRPEERAISLEAGVLVPRYR